MLELIISIQNGKVAKEESEILKFVYRSFLSVMLFISSFMYFPMRKNLGTLMLMENSRLRMSRILAAVFVYNIYFLNCLKVSI